MTVKVRLFGAPVTVSESRFTVTKKEPGTRPGQSVNEVLTTLKGGKSSLILGAFPRIA